MYLKVSIVLNLIPKNQQSFLLHHSVLPKGRSFTANSGTQTAVLPKGRYFTANSGTKVAVLLGMNRCGSFPLISAPHSLFSIWIDFSGYEKIPGAPAWKWGEWIWLTRPSGLHRNSPQGLNISSITVFDHVRDPGIPIAFVLWISIGDPVVQAVRRSSSISGIQISRLGTPMWVWWWTKRSFDRFFSGFLPFSPTTNFIPPFLYTHFNHFVSFHSPLRWCVRHGRPASLLLVDLR